MHAGVHVATTELYTPEPSLELMMRIWREHPETLNMATEHIGAATSAVRWLEVMKPEERVVALRFFCRKCGELLGTNGDSIEMDVKKPSRDLCDKCQPAKNTDGDLVEYMGETVHRRDLLG